MAKIVSYISESFEELSNMTWPEPEVPTIVVAIFHYSLWQHGSMIFASALAGFLTG
jgi:hypothetical protein